MKKNKPEPIALDDNIHCDPSCPFLCHLSEDKTICKYSEDKELDWYDYWLAECKINKNI
jgi:hypothetical protein